MKIYARDYLEIFFSSTTPLFDSKMCARFKEVRQELGLTQAEIARKIGLTQTDVSRIEAGKCLTTEVKTDRFKAAFGDWFRYFMLGGVKPLRLTMKNDQFAGENYWKAKKLGG
jgi:transcriptional regulator with XRE-family HTH domain